MAGRPKKLIYTPIGVWRFWLVPLLSVASWPALGAPLPNTCRWVGHATLGHQATRCVPRRRAAPTSCWTSAYDLKLPLKLNAAANSRLFGPPPPRRRACHAHGQQERGRNWIRDRKLAPLRRVANRVCGDGGARRGCGVVTLELAPLPIYAEQWHLEANAFDRDHATVNRSI
jgi:hypothetical protein